ncbi:endonuclease domain-containing protein [Demequina iriomotensis]|uniref:endonuclease domain-containing protein n=1 Tax=Demequina iriomotensis TaxID=1536641 RepID=UPI0007866E45|nr:DUF559 domain-containing protein [Demequina iriomotensis]
MPDRVHAGAATFTRGELIAMTTSAKVRTAIATGEIVAVLPGRYASAAHAESWLARTHAAVAATHGVITGAAALFLAGAGGRPPARIDLVIPEARHGLDVEWLGFVRRPHPPPAVRWRELDIAMPAHAAIDLWCRGRERDRVGGVLRALQRRVTSPAELRSAMEGTPRIRDRAGLIALVEAFEAGAHSFLEHEGLTSTFAAREFARFVRQHRVVVRGRVAHLDMYDPDTRTAVELDGSEFHEPGEQREQDIRRDADLATLGIQTVRLSYNDVMRRPAWCRATVLAVLERRAAHDPSRLPGS